MIPVISREHACRLIKGFKERLAARIGERLSAVVLFGSYATGRVSEESDIDVAVLVESLTEDDRWIIAQEAAASMMRERIVLSALPMDRAEYDDLLAKERALHVDISREGIWL